MANEGIVRRPAVPPPVRIRRDINTLSLNDPIVVGYGNAIAAMRNRALNDPLSWRYQAAIHDYPPNDATFTDRTTGPKADPLARPNDVLPADRGTHWRQCQHLSWFFLPWHRMYLHHFEKIVAAEVARQGGPADWALPYWRWNGPGGVGRLPLAFRDPAVGGLASLFIPQREARANSGQQFADPVAEVDIQFDCLRPTVYRGAGQFGGPPVRRHDRDDPVAAALNGAGLLEGTPHGTMHNAVAGPTGFMRTFTGAPLDPIFWLHHCNIDRLWDVWVQRAPGNVNPDEAAWLNESFTFHDATGGDGTMTVRQVLNTRRAPLSYEYDDTTDPLAGP